MSMRTAPKSNRNVARTSQHPTPRPHHQGNLPTQLLLNPLAPPNESNLMNSTRLRHSIPTTDPHLKAETASVGQHSIQNSHSNPKVLEILPERRSGQGGSGVATPAYRGTSLIEGYLAHTGVPRSYAPLATHHTTIASPQIDKRAL